MSGSIYSHSIQQHGQGISQMRGSVATAYNGMDKGSPCVIPSLLSIYYTYSEQSFTTVVAYIPSVGVHKHLGHWILAFHSTASWVEGTHQQYCRPYNYIIIITISGIGILFKEIDNYTAPSYIPALSPEQPTQLLISLPAATRSITLTKIILETLPIPIRHTPGHLSKAII